MNDLNCDCGHFCSSSCQKDFDCPCLNKCERKVSKKLPTESGSKDPFNNDLYNNPAKDSKPWEN